MTSYLRRATLLLSTAMGLMVFNGAQAAAQTGPRASDDNGDGVEEIVVTATKRAESSLEVPMGLTALSGDDLQRDQLYRLEDIVGHVPGLNVSETQGAQLVVRGIASTAFSINAPVATYIDETPLVGVGTFSGGSSNTPTSTPTISLASRFSKARKGRCTARPRSAACSNTSPMRRIRRVSTQPYKPG